MRSLQVQPIFTPIIFVKAFPSFPSLLPVALCWLHHLLPGLLLQYPPNWYLASRLSPLKFTLSIAKFASHYLIVSHTESVNDFQLLTGKCLNTWSSFMIWILPSLSVSSLPLQSSIFKEELTVSRNLAHALTLSLSEFSFSRRTHPKYLVFSTHPWEKVQNFKFNS